jgi:hypothetical protein
MSRSYISSPPNASVACSGTALAFLGLETMSNLYSHIPKSVTEYEGTTVSLNRGLQADREVLASRLVIILKNKKVRMCLLKD